MRYYLILILLLVFSTPAQAQMLDHGLPENADQITVQKNQAKLEINGAVCPYCAYGMQKSLRKQKFVDKKQASKGIEVDVDNQMITLYIKDGFDMDLNDVYKAIKKGGYEPRVFHLRVSGQTETDGTQTFLTNAEGKRMFELIGDKVNHLDNQQTHELQLLIDEMELAALKKNPLPKAHIHTIIQGE